MISPTGIGSRRGWFEVLWNLECPVGLSQREICAHFNEGHLAQFGWSAEKYRIVELRSDMLNLVGRNVAMIGPSRC